MTVNVGLARENDNHLQSFADSECLAPGFDASGICIKLTRSGRIMWLSGSFDFELDLK